MPRAFVMGLEEIRTRVPVTSLEEAPITSSIDADGAVTDSNNIDALESTRTPYSKYDYDIDWLVVVTADISNGKVPYLV